MSRSSGVELAELTAAYRRFDVEFRASALAIRRRYRELAWVYRPDKWPESSSPQTNATNRMREIDAAYHLIRRAPLRHHALANDPFEDRDRSANTTWLERAVINILSSW